MSEFTSPSVNSVLIVDDEADVRDACTQLLELEGFDVKGAADAETALTMISWNWPGVLITDMRMPRKDGLELFKLAREIDPALPVIFITAHGDISIAVSAIREGAFDFIEKPAEPDALIKTVHMALEKRRLVLENRTLRGLLADGAGIGSRLIGQSPLMRSLRNTVTMLSEAAADVLIVGETGAGKELVARCLHEFSPRRDERFVALNCGALPESLVESELFGHVSGAFTGARGQRVGKIEYANRGTLFLDEIESMPLSIQAKFLRVLQERTFERLGGNESIEVDIRVIAAAKPSIEQAQEEGKFRSDLYYRLNVANIEIPPLRERREDIPLLFNHFVELAAKQYKRPEPGPPVTLPAQLVAHVWPGNVRELKNLAERYVLGLPLSVEKVDDVPAERSESRSLGAQVEFFEQLLICEALKTFKGRVDRTAEYLEMPRKTLYLRMRKYGIKREDYAQADEA